MKKYFESFLSRCYTSLLSIKDAIDIGSGSLVFYKSKIVDKSKCGGGKDWISMSYRYF
ncbi:MAG: hypothetical protein PARBB_00858 [Parabacteroides distasonis]